MNGVILWSKIQIGSLVPAPQNNTEVPDVILFVPIRLTSVGVKKELNELLPEVKEALMRRLEWDGIEIGCYCWDRLTYDYSLYLSSDKPYVKYEVGCCNWSCLEHFHLWAKQKSI